MVDLSIVTVEADTSVTTTGEITKEKESNNIAQTRKIAEEGILPKTTTIINASFLRSNLNKLANKGEDGRLEQEPANLKGKQNSEHINLG